MARAPSLAARIVADSGDLLFKAFVAAAFRGGPQNRNESNVTIYIPLLNEGTDCWRPVEAEQIGTNSYRILQIKPDDEEWPIGAGDIVTCKLRRFSDGSEGLTVILPPFTSQ